MVVYTRESFTKRVRELTNGAGVPVVYDSVGKATFEAGGAHLVVHGVHVVDLDVERQGAGQNGRVLGRGAASRTRPRARPGLPGVARRTSRRRR